MALFAAAPSVSAQQLPPGLTLTLEGGTACGIAGGMRAESGTQIGASFPALASATLGDNHCGWLGRIGLSQSQRGMLGGLVDSWGLFWREQRIPGDVGTVTPLDPFLGRYRNAFTADTAERRTVIDFEIGKDLGVGDSLRVVGGLRYARFDGKTALSGIYTDTNFPNLPYFFNAGIRTTFDGFGPRLGLTGRLPLGAGLSLVLDGYGSALHGERKTTISAVHGIGSATGATPADATASDSGWLLNLEGEAALAMPLFGPSTELQLGVRGESWFNQTVGAKAGPDCDNAGSKTVGCTRLGAGDRHGLAPFARLMVKLN